MVQLAKPRAVNSGALAGLLISLALPSSALVQRYAGNTGVVIYVVATLATLALVLRYRQKVSALMAPISFWWLAAITTAALLLVFVVVYPIANVQVPGRGSDGDDAIQLGALALLQGRSPYNQVTYLGNPTVNLPGALLLALPFAAVGRAALQNIFWLFMLLVGLRAYLEDGRSAVLAVWLILLLAPAVIHALVVGTDQLANSIYVLLAIVGLLSVTRKLQSPTAAILGMAALLGVALTSRANFLLLTPLVFSALLASRGWRIAAKAMTTTLAVVALLTAPFYLADTAGFAPLNTANKLNQFAVVLPHAGRWVIGLDLLLAVALAFRRKNAHMPTLLARCACVLALPVIAGVLLSSLHSQQVVLGFAKYGMFALFFGVAASWGLLPEDSPIVTEPMGHKATP